MWGSFPVLELTLGVWPCPQGLQAGAQGKERGKEMSPTMGAPDWGQGLGREKEGRGDTCWAEDPVCFSTLALLPLPPPGDPAGGGGCQVLKMSLGWWASMRSWGRAHSQPHQVPWAWIDPGGLQG